MVCEVDQMVMKAEAREMEIREIFDDYDQDKSGSIDKSELKCIIIDLGLASLETPDDKLEQLVSIELEKADLNHDGVISFGEFVHYYNSIKDAKV
ncbi:hypothetical protein CYMTET_3336 [Cymbomonas tetramitiformis]|uniref:EF-hand domain-containing protein n=1 Tax=Cymbomonas tetramitiformis TaxID=36881 RepID=A0AAE0LLH4_9CHLO|nr:hypothetical protein CYMTET_3336 [Cymbomonas tetramitiformis]